MIKNLQPRLYQQSIFNTATKYNTLVVLPTGLGKTAIALMLTAYRLNQYPSSQVLVLAPTKPLCQQHWKTFRNHLEIDPEKVVLFTGEIPPEKRLSLWQGSQIICSTPQSLENDLINGKIDLQDVVLLVIDECHHTTGKYAYVWVAQQYYQKARFPRIIALTASPGSDLEKIKETCRNLFIEKVEVRTDEDNDVRPYIKKVGYQYLEVKLTPELEEIKSTLNNSLKSKIEEAKKYGYIHSNLTKKQLLQLQANLFGKIREEKDFLILKTISLIAEIIKIQHALELIESQGINQLYLYFEKLKKEAEEGRVKAVKNLWNDPYFKQAFFLTEELRNKGIKHPKITKLKEFFEEEIKKNSELKTIVFTQYRHSASEIVETLNRIEGIKAKIFVGQLKKGETGLSQKEQKKIIEEFHQGEFNILVSTSVGEEGLDIPAVDLVVFYEPIPSVIRTIQRRGRTGRLSSGRVAFLITEKTRDAVYGWTSYRREKRQKFLLKKIKEEFSSPILPKKVTLTQFIPEEKKVVVLADYREKNNLVVKQLMELGLSIKLEKLETADYLLSGRVAVELKTVEDFVNSITDGRLLEQAKELKRNFERAIIIIEGEEDIYSVRKVNAKAIQGMMASLIIDYGLSLIQTKNYQETASLLALAAKREQDKDFYIQLHEKKPLTIKEQQEYFITSLPNVGINLAKEILRHFGTIKNFVNAREEELKKVPRLGEKLSKKIKELVESKYEGDFN